MASDKGATRFRSGSDVLRSAASLSSSARLAYCVCACEKIFHLHDVRSGDARGITWLEENSSREPLDIFHPFACFEFFHPCTVAGPRHCVSVKYPPVHRLFLIVVIPPSDCFLSAVRI